MNRGFPVIPDRDFTNASLHRTAAAWLAKKVAALQPDTVLEFGLGAGVGTRTILNNCNARVVSVEHQQRWIDYSKEWNVYGERLEIVGYNEIPAHDYDFVMIDGKDRHKCLVSHWDKLLSGAVIILDDANRATEKEIMEKWKTEPGIKFEFLNIGRGIGVAYK